MSVCAEDLENWFSQMLANHTTMSPRSVQIVLQVLRGLPYMPLKCDV